MIIRRHHQGPVTDRLLALLWHLPLPPLLLWAADRAWRWWVMGLRGTTQPSLDAAAIWSISAADILSFRVTLPLEALGSVQEAVALEVERRTPFEADEVAIVYDMQSAGRTEVHVHIALTLARAPETSSYIAFEDGQERLLLSLMDKWRIAFGTLQLRRASLAGLSLLLLGIALWSPVWKLQTRSQALQAENTNLRAQVQARAVDRQQALRAQQAQARLTTFRLDHPSALVLLARLTEALDDNTYLSEVRYGSDGVFLRGQSRSAAEALQALTAVPVFSNVRFVSSVAIDTDQIETFQIRFNYGLEKDS